MIRGSGVREGLRYVKAGNFLCLYSGIREEVPFSLLLGVYKRAVLVTTGLLRGLFPLYLSFDATSLSPR